MARCPETVAEVSGCRTPTDDLRHSTTAARFGCHNNSRYHTDTEWDPEYGHRTARLPDPGPARPQRGVAGRQYGQSESLRSGSITGAVPCCGAHRPAFREWVVAEIRFAVVQNGRQFRSDPEC